MTSWHSYPKIYNLGHSALTELFDDEVLIEEKVDGSQFSFGVFDGVLKCRSKGQELVVEAPEKLFTLAVETVKSLQALLKPGYTYRGEFLRIPKHNALAYDRVPAGNIILFDISPAEETYLSYDEKKAEATRLGLEVVPILYQGNTLKTVEQFTALLEKVSILGGQKIEGAVIKNYKKFGPDKKVLLGKHVSEAFKEVHQRDWKKSNPKQDDLVTTLREQYRSKARWNKAVQHLVEQGKLENSPRDIPLLFKEAMRDIEDECKAEIAEALVKWAMPQILRHATKGLAEWYKEELVKKQFESKKET